MNTVQTTSDNPTSRRGSSRLAQLLLPALLALVLGWGAAASAATTTFMTNFVVGAPISDASTAGRVSATNVVTRVLTATGIKVNLNISGTYNGDLYCTLVHSSGRAVLLNRVGRRTGSSLGYGDDGINVTFDDAAANGDVHVYRATLGRHTTPITGPLTGTWAPDGRTTGPSSVLASDSRTALLSSFNGLNPNGEWVLFIADVESGDIHTLESWGLEITGYEGPSIACSANANVECAGLVPAVDLGSVTASSGCPGMVTVTHIRDVISSQTCANRYTLTRTYRATDACGNTNDCAQVITVNDITAPVLVGVPAATTVQCSAVPAPAVVTATDTCDASPSVSLSETSTQNPDAAVCGHYSYSITRTWTATDACANSATASQIITVQDTTAPALSACPANIGPVYTLVAGGASVDFTAPTATDNCDANPTVVCSPVSGSTFAPGTTTVTCTASDACGNSSECMFTVTVELNHAPVAGNNTMGAVQNHARSVLVEKLLSNDTDSDDDMLTITAVSATSAQGGSVTFNSLEVIYTPATGFTGTDTFTYTVSDGKGGTATATVTVTVRPESDITANIVSIAPNGTGGFRIRFAGIPGETYQLQRTTTLLPAAWADLGAPILLGESGVAEFEDVAPPPGAAFYRTANP